jgi:Fe-S-cluster containining protein
VPEVYKTLTFGRTPRGGWGIKLTYFILIEGALGEYNELMAAENPCVSCGACCSYFRVLFWWRETSEKGGENVPDPLTEEVDQIRQCMKGTNAKHAPRCVALKGKVGDRAVCSIYANRPSPCRDFKASFENGERYKRCDEARIAHGLKPLALSDWAGVTNDA